METKQLTILAYMFTIIVMVALITNAAAGKKKPQVLDFDQFDSLCVADSIPRDLGTWDKQDVYDETREKVITIFSLNKGDSVSYEVTFGDDRDFNVIKDKK